MKIKNIKNTDQLFRILKIKKNFLNENQKNFLNKNGYIVFKSSRNIKDKIKELNLVSQRLINNERDKGGWEGKEKHYRKGKKFESGADRLGNLINKKLWNLK